MNMVSILGLILGLGYLVITLLLKNKWQTFSARQTPEDFLPKTPISVLVAAKNESENIGSLVHHLLAQNYPKNLVEFIIVNDHSTDDTLAQIAKINLPDNFHVIDAISNGKKAAITQGVALANGELMVTTDADCVMGAQWLQSIAWLYETQQPKFMASPVAFYREESFLERFQSLDFLGMMLITGAGIQSNKFYMANGANMAFPKSVFESVNGYEGNQHIASGDDMFLVNKVAQRFPKGVQFNKNLDALVRTRAAVTWSSFFRQRIRWGSKNTASEDKVLKIILAWVFFTSFWLVLFVGAKYWVLVLLLKLVGDYVLLREASAYFGRKDLLRVFVPSFVVHTIYIAVIGLISLFWNKVRWK